MPFLATCIFSRENRISSAIVSFTQGELAQLGERVTGSHEVRGSNPLFSTMITPQATQWPACYGRAVRRCISSGWMD